MAQSLLRVAPAPGWVLAHPLCAPTSPLARAIYEVCPRALRPALPLGGRPGPLTRDPPSHSDPRARDRSGLLARGSAWRARVCPTHPAHGGRERSRLGACAWVASASGDPAGE